MNEEQVALQLVMGAELVGADVDAGDWDSAVRTYAAGVQLLVGSMGAAAEPAVHGWIGAVMMRVGVARCQQLHEELPAELLARIDGAIESVQKNARDVGVRFPERAQA